MYLSSTMFGKKTHADVKKSTQKVLDNKKDSATRLKHLRIVLENVDPHEAKTFFEANYSHIYYILYDSFIIAEANLRQRVHKTHREELDAVLYLLEKVFTLLPELLQRKWQCHSLMRIMKKLIHPGNSLKLRREAQRLFLVWYQTLGEQAPQELHAMFATLVPGFPSPVLSDCIPTNSKTFGVSTASTAIFHDGSQGPVAPVEICPVLPPQSGEKQPDDLTHFFLECLMECMVSQVSKIQWWEGLMKQQKCFYFLFERFKKCYLVHIFPEFSWSTSLYKPTLDLPELRRFVVGYVDVGDGKKLLDPLMSCKVVVIRWVANFTHIVKNNTSYVSSSQLSSIGEDGDSRKIYVQPSDSASQAESSHTTSEPLSMPSLNDDLLAAGANIVREILYSSRENVNFIHEVYRQAFLLNFTNAIAIRKVIAVYKDWIQMNVPELPPFMLEPLDYATMREDYSHSRSSSNAGDSNSKVEHLLQVFVTNSANVFLLEIGPEYPSLLEEQVDLCKRVLNIYRYMVMNTRMEEKTWEQLLLVLLQITSLLLTEIPPKRKEFLLGARLAPALFQTLIVTWIKANLNVLITSELWDQFLDVLSSLTEWEELIREWAKTLETLTRVLARHVYNLDLNDLPLDRLSEQKAKKKRGKQGPPDPHLGLSYESNRRLSETPSEKHMMNVGECQDNSLSSTCMNGSSYSWKGMLLDETLPKAPQGHKPSQVHGLLVRSLSESNLTGSHARKCQNKDSHSRYQKKAMHKLNRKKSRSMDSLRHIRVHINDTDVTTRTPSPAPSSGVESNSIKDSPMQIDFLGGETTSLDMAEASSMEHRSVIAGGSVRGWLPDVSVVLWRRMLGILGDINQISRPSVHFQVFQYLLELCDTLQKMRKNQSVSLDNMHTPPPPELLPPTSLIASWCFSAVILPSEYQKGKLCAYALLCNITVTKHDIPLPREHISQFYRVLHTALAGDNQDIIDTIVKNCSARYLSVLLPGFSILLYDFLHGASSVLCSSNLKKAPRTEAITYVGSLVSFGSILDSMTTLEPESSHMKMIPCTRLKDDVLRILIQCGKREPTGLARCIAISSLGIYLYQELTHHTFHKDFQEAVDVLLMAVRFNNKAVAQVAADMLLLLCDHVDGLFDNFPDLPCKIIEVLALTLPVLMPVGKIDFRVQDQHLLISLLFCLGEWCMHVPQVVLIQDGASLLLTVFKVLNIVSQGFNHSDGTIASVNSINCEGFDPNIQLDNLSRQDSINSKSPRRHTKEEVRRSPSQIGRTVQLAARTVMTHLVNTLSHFPIGIGAARNSSLVSENDDVSSLHSDELSLDVFHAPNVQFFVLNASTLLSLVELPTLDVPGGGATAGFQTALSQVRVILRDLSGKASWDASILYGPPSEHVEFQDETIPGSSGSADLTLPKMKDDPMMTSSFHGSMMGSPPHHAIRRRPASVLPTYENSADDLDNLDDLLQYIGYTSPECLNKLEESLNLPVVVQPSLPQELEEDTITMLINQRTIENDYVIKHEHDPSLVAGSQTPTPPSIAQSPFQHCRLFFNQLGLAGWERRPHVDLLSKNDKLLRELKNLDTQKCRETHKIAVIYVAEGQEDKISILNNAGGSQPYEEFVAGLAWEVELETHTGFMGGLQKNKSSGDTAPYFATSFMEVIFHVATRMPSGSEERMLQKTRHLGNDEIHIVWCEHTRDYRRGIIPTEFCDVLIVIYPLPNKLFHIQISRKPEVPYFGPLFNESIVDHKVLPGLVRATAINASRAKRRMLPFYQNYYEERAKALQTLIQNHREQTSFEDFAANVYSPVLPPIFRPGPVRASGTSFVPRTADDHVRYSHTSNVAAALIDSHPSPGTLRPCVGHVYSITSQGEPRARVSEASSPDISDNQNQSISPKLPKRMSFKSNSRKSSDQKDVLQLG